MNEDKRTLHIQGVGHAEQAPDWVVVSLSLTAQNKDYSAALKIGSQQVEMLRESIAAVGFKSDDLKTTNFDVRTIYEDEEYREGSIKRYRQVFVCFECRHNLQLAFNMDNDKLNAAVNAISNCLSEPKINIAFTIKDVETFVDKLLKSAARDAKRKARVLCVAAGVQLGKLLSMDYSWNEFSVRHEINLAPQKVLGTDTETAFDFQPEDVNANDTVDFIWEIE